MTQYKHMRRSAMALAALLVGIALAVGAIRPALALRPALSVTDYHVASGTDPWGTAFDKNGNVWVAVPSCDPNPTCNKTPAGKIEVFNPSSSTWTNTYQLPSSYSQALFMAIDKNGNVWFPLFMSNAIGMLNPSTKVFHKYTVPTTNAGPWDIVIDHNGKIWFTEHFTNKIGRFDPVTHQFMEVKTPASDSQPYGITVDAKDNIWFTENNSSVALIGKYTTAGKLLEYKIRNSPPGGLTPHLITVDPNGNIWWSEGFVGKIGELKVSQAKPGTNNGVTEYTYKSNGGNEHTSGISTDKNGKIWFDDSEQEVFGSFPDSGTGSFSLHNIPTQNGHPHDGLNVDSQNRVWFDEEFAEKIAKAIQ
jgi:streptogramin lyase